MKTGAANTLGYLIVGHGTRDPAGQGEFREVVRQLAVRSSVPVAGAFLELAEPRIAQGLQSLAANGVRRVLIVPLLLFTAGHAKEDVPAEVAQAAAALGMEVIGQSGALELHPALLELSRTRFWEAAGSSPDLTGTVLLMVGRGGSDAAAIAAMKQYAATLAEELRIEEQTGFVALAQPTLDNALAALAMRKPERVIVLPHLLFQGEVLATIQARVAEAAALHPATRWQVAAPLGSHALLVDAVQGRIREINGERRS